MPTFAELLAQLSFLAATPSAVGALITAGLLIVFLDWRTSVFALACQTIFAGLLYSQVLPPQIAGVKVVVGLLICLQMFVTARQMDGNKMPAELPEGLRSAQKQGGGAEPSGSSLRSIVPTGLPFRIVAALMVGVIAWQGSLLPELSLPEVPPSVGLATIGLLALGLLGLGLTEEPLKAGMFLITMLTGFELYYSAVEPALAVIALLAAMDFAVALGACYLAVVRALRVPDRSAAK
ncbi:MAG: hypothetical protein AAB217_07495 [Chloroflexota bacterium]